MSADSELCRKVWAALEKYPALRVGSVIVDSATYRWSCLVRVPWDRFAVVAASLEDVAELAAKLERWEATKRALAEQIAKTVVANTVVVAQYSSGEKQLGLF